MAYQWGVGSLDNVRGELVKQMQSTPGWKIVVQEARSIMDDASNKLLRVPPSEVEEIARLQERHKTIERFMNIINSIAKEV